MLVHAFSRVFFSRKQENFIRPSIWNNDNELVRQSTLNVLVGPLVPHFSVYRNNIFLSVETFVVH